MSRRRNVRKKTVARNRKYPLWDKADMFPGWNKHIRIVQKILNGNPIMKDQ